MSKLLFDFADAQAVRGWAAIDDRVMGGVSISSLRHDPLGHAVFEGEVSLERQGGFASVRCAPGHLGHQGAVACVIDARGHGKRFKLSLITDDSLDTVSYQTEFEPSTQRMAGDPPPDPGVQGDFPRTRSAWRTRARPGTDTPDRAHDRRAASGPLCPGGPLDRPGLTTSAARARNGGASASSSRRRT
jgi:hypothetical protein